MSKKVYPFTALTGGGSGALDALASINSGSPLADLDVALVTTASDFYPYSYDIDSGLAEDSPKIIKGDDEGGNSRFSLVRGNFDGINSYGNIISSGTASIDGAVSVGGTLTVPTITISGNVDGRDLSVDGAKLDNIEASADVTDSTNVNAAGAVMESDYNAQTVLVAVSNNAPTAITIPEQTIVGRLTGGNVATVCIGVADNEIVQVDDVDATANDYAKFTANGLEGRSYSEVLGDLSGEADADFAMNTHKITGVVDPTTDQDAATKKYVDDNIIQYYGLEWDESGDSYSRTGSLTGVATASKPSDSLIPIQAGMRRCIVDDSGNVVYYLDPSDSTKKLNGGASVLTGADGQVMVEIPKFYYKYDYSGTVHTWEISRYPLSGFSLHPAFNKDGAVVDYRYIGAYEGVLYDTSETKYVNGLYLPTSADYKMTFTNADDKIESDTLTHPFSNLEVGVDKIVVSSSDSNDGTYDIVTKGDDYITIGAGGTLTNEANSEVTIQVQRDWTATSGDVLSSVSGKAPMSQGTRAQFREAALNRGAGWRQQDYDLISAIQLLYLVEYGSFYSQSMIGAGLTDWTSVSWTAWNNYNPIETTGNSNSDGNATANVSGGDGVVGSYVSYRGIENFFGHLWKWVDGFNINDNIPYVNNTEAQFADNTVTNYTRLEDTGGSGITLHNVTGYQITLEQTKRGFLPSAVGGSSSTYITDSYYQSTGWRVAILGGHAGDGVHAGFFCWALHNSSGTAHQTISGRLCR